MDENTSTQAQINNAVPASAIPATWPGAWGLYKYSKQAVMLNIWPLVALFAVSILLNIFSDLSPILSLVVFLVSGVVSVAMSLVLFAGTKDEKMSLGKSLSLGFSLRALKYLVNVILLMLIAAGSLLLLIVPFFFIFPRVILAPYFVALENKGPIEAIENSWNITKGHVGKIYGIIGVSIVFALLIVVLVGIYFTLMYAASFTILYAFLKKLAPVVETTTTPEPTPAAENETVQPTAQ